MLERPLAGRFAQLTNRALPRFLSAALDLSLLSPLYITPLPHIIEYRLPHLQPLQSLKNSSSHPPTIPPPPPSNPPPPDLNPSLSPTPPAHQRPPPLTNSTHNHAPPSSISPPHPATKSTLPLPLPPQPLQPQLQPQHHQHPLFLKNPPPRPLALRACTPPRAR